MSPGEADTKVTGATPAARGRVSFCQKTAALLRHGFKLESYTDLDDRLKYALTEQGKIKYESDSLHPLITDAYAAVFRTELEPETMPYDKLIAKRKQHLKDKGLQGLFDMYSGDDAVHLPEQLNTLMAKTMREFRELLQSWEIDTIEEGGGQSDFEYAVYSQLLADRGI